MCLIENLIFKVRYFKHERVDIKAKLKNSDDHTSIGKYRKANISEYHIIFENYRTILTCIN